MMDETNEIQTKSSRTERWMLIGVLLLLLNSGYLSAFSQPSVPYLINVFLHVALGLLLLLPFAGFGWRFLREHAYKGKELGLFTGHVGYWSLLAGLAAGVYLAFIGANSSNRWLLMLHVVFCCLGLVMFVTSIREVGHQVSVDNRFNTAGRWLLVCTAAGACIPILVFGFGLVYPSNDGRIFNSQVPPTSMNNSRSPEQPFAPSSASFRNGDPHAEFLMSSQTCGQSGCHPDIYRQWSRSAHSYPAFENPWYKAAVAEMEKRAAKGSSQWCAGCHAPSVLFSQSATSIEEQSRLPEAEAGIPCTACHSITNVKSTRGGADYEMESPSFLGTASSSNGILKGVHDIAVHFDPEPHRRTYRKPFHSKDNGKFCSACHKAHTDSPLNGRSWFGVMNDYDSWQNSSFSGKGARDFYQSVEEKDCAGCHMPLTPSTDAGNKEGMVHDHRFIGANTFVPMARKDDEHLRSIISFLQDRKISLDIFALSLAPPAEIRHEPDAAQAKEKPAIEQRVITASAVPDDWTVSIMEHKHHLTTAFQAPFEQVPVRVPRGQSVRIDVVVRTRGTGHNFPGGAADLSEAWVELQAVDNMNRVIFWSGALDSSSRVDPSAHFFGTVMVDSLGKRVFHYESWAAAAAAHSNLLPPNSAEIVRYRLVIPEDCGERIRLTARLNYRQFGFHHAEAVRDSFGESASLSEYLRSIRALPVVEMARHEAVLHVTGGRIEPKASEPKRDAERWNDYGIGLMRQGDLTGAERAFQKACQLDSPQPDFWINMGIVWLLIGKLGEAETALQHAVTLTTSSARAYYYLSLAEKARGNYKRALSALREATDLSPRDREVRIEIGKLSYMIEDYGRAIRSFDRALRIDSEDPVAYFDKMQTYLAQGDSAAAAEEQRQYLRFSRNAAMDSLAARARARLAPLDLPAETYHEHLTAPLNSLPQTKLDASNGWPQY